jgi:hypothetical protein
MALIGAGYGDGWEHLFDEVAVTAKGALFPLPARLERGPAGAEDYCYESAMPLLDGVVDGENRTAVHEQDPGIQEVRGSRLLAFSLPAILRRKSHSSRLYHKVMGACILEWLSLGAGFRDQRRQSELGRAG